MTIGYTVPQIWHMTNAIVIFHFGLYFSLLCPPPPPNSPKIENFKKMKKMSGDIITSVPKIMIISYTVLEIWHMMDVIVIFHLGQIFCPFTP